MQLNPHLGFNGQCEAAFKFYEKCLRGKIVTLMTFGDSPMAEQMPSAWRGKIIHATVAMGDQRLTGGDVPPESYQKPQGFYVLLNVGDAAEADRIFKALAENGVVQMPVQQTFWALRFGMLVDQFGTPWMINCGKPE
jgi:PhnB protein